MKFLTYKEHNNHNQIFGFKYKEELIDINKSALYFIDKYSDDRFLSIPKTLKEALVNWDRNFIIERIRNKISQEDISSFSIKEKDALILPLSQTLHHSETFMHLSNMSAPQENLEV